ncbi:MAG: hypothetical protein AB1571_04340 [Nanoarchaeota archaeon]
MNNLNLTRLVGDLLLETKVATFKDGLAFFKVIAGKAFEDMNLNLMTHATSFEYTCNMLNEFIKPNKKLGYFSDLKNDTTKVKEFADSYCFINGIFPEALENKLKSRAFYIDCTKRAYSLLSIRKNDSFYLLSKNIADYIKALNTMKNKYLNGNYVKHVLSKDRVLH